jgi:hypothetical protein
VTEAGVFGSFAPHVQYSFTNDKFRMGMLGLFMASTKLVVISQPNAPHLSMLQELPSMWT